MIRVRRMTSLFIMCCMLLGVKNGYLALWKEEDPQPAQIFPVRVSSLPLSDQLLLRRGIPVDDARTLLALLEDYL